MKKLTFGYGVIIALLLSLTAAALFAALTPSFSASLVMRGVISLLSFIYMLILLSASGIRFGRITTAATAVTLITVIFYIAPPLKIFLLFHIGLIWLTRCFYYHSHALTACADLGLSLLGFAAAIWAAEQSQSLFLAVWCFLLVQAAILPTLHTFGRSKHQTSCTHMPDNNEDFQRALRSAEAALRKASI